MAELSDLIVFTGASLAVLLVPGPAVLYVVTRSAREGRRVGLASVLGLHVGTLIHVLAALVGLSALLMSSAVAFGVVKWAGGAYLVFLGVKTLLGRGEAGAVAPDRGAGARRAFRQGIVVNALNPKLALFFLAFLPQFVDPTGAVGGQLLVLGMWFVVLGIVSDGIYALLAATAGTRLRLASGRLGRWVAGSIYLGLGAATVVSGGD